MSLDTFTVMSLNVNGMHSYGHYASIFSRYLYASSPTFPRPDVVFFQETHCTKEIEHQMLSASNYDMCFANKTARSGRLITGFNRSLNYNVTGFQASEVGNSQFLFVHCTIEYKEYVLVNVYVHADDNFKTVIAALTGKLNELDQVDVI